MYRVLLFMLLCSYSIAGFSQATITVTTKGTENQEVYLAYYFGNKQYISDTVLADARGMAQFKMQEDNKPGIYLYVGPSKNYFEFLFEGKSASFTADTSNLSTSVATSDSPTNKAFFERTQRMREWSTKRNEIMEENKDVSNDQVKVLLAALNREVSNYDEDFRTKNAHNMAGKVVTATQDPKIPDQLKDDARYYWYRDHYFDNIDFKDEWLVRSPIFDNKLDKFMLEMIVQHPDTINKYADWVLEKTSINEELYQYTLIKLTNYHASSKAMGAVNTYVHLVGNYYLKGKAPWVDNNQLEKMEQRYYLLKNNVLFAEAPALEVQDPAGNALNLIAAAQKEPYRFTVLFFRSIDCDHCKDAADELKAYLPKKESDVQVLAVITDLDEEADTKKLSELHLEWQAQGHAWKHFQPTGKRFRIDYAIQFVPMLYILDKDGVIIARSIGADQVETIISDHRRQ